MRESTRPAIETSVTSTARVDAEEIGNDAELWREVTSARDPAVFARAWLAIVARSFPAILQGAMLLGEPARGKLDPVARWAKDAAAGRSDLLAAAGAAILRTVIESRRPAIEAPDADSPVVAGLPFVLDDTVHGAVLIEAQAGDAIQSRRLLRHLHWGSAWVETFLRRSVGERDAGAGARAVTLIDTLNATVSAETFDAAAWTFMQRLAAVFKAERVAMGRRKRLKTKVIKLHQVSTVDRRSVLARALAQAMDEAIDQGRPLSAPGEGVTIVPAQDAVLAKGGARAVLSVPLAQGDMIFGAVTMERFTGGAFSEDEIALADALAAAVTPLLVDKRTRDRALPVIAAQRFGRVVSHIVSLKSLAVTGAVAAVIAAAAFLATAESDYSIHARAQIQGEIRRVINAPFDGYLSASSIRAGATVKQGDVLAEMQDSDLAIERLRHVAERRQHELELDRALAKDDLAAVNIARAQMAAEDAQIDLDDQMLARTQIRAPFDGIVVAGDLSQAIGRPVARGDSLFELAPLDRYRVSMVAEEADVADVRVGAPGELLLTALPDQPLAFVVTAVTPVARTADGANGFEVQGALIGTPPALRPAMEGTAKIDAGRRRLVWIWSHKLIDWARLTVWKWLP
ncbi:MAG TPA: HlyD family efflux transporter periplasmic adaptor subunit [Bauldia sp.]|nr:HlyD family efflux transporter periplasmic adaptor subunit [Bauldia sp.]